MPFGIDVTSITALATWAIAIGTIAILWWQTHVSQRLNSANAVMALRERFDAPGMRRARRTLSGRLLAGKHEDITNLEVASFFELIGTLVHRRVLERHLVWEAFGTWVNGYYYALRHPVDIIGRARRELSDPLIMHEYEWLQGVTSRIDQRLLGAGYASEQQDRDESIALLRRESELDTD